MSNKISQRRRAALVLVTAILAGTVILAVTILLYSVLSHLYLHGVVDKAPGEVVSGILVIQLQHPRHPLGVIVDIGVKELKMLRLGGRYPLEITITVYVMW